MAAIDLRPVLGAKPDGKTGPRFLMVCYYDPNGISTVYEHVRLWQKFSHFAIQVLNLWPRTPLRIPPNIDLNDFVGAILHPTVGYFPANLTGLDNDLRTGFAEYRGLKVLVKQDEHFHSAAFPKFLAENSFDILVTCVPSVELEKVYPRAIIGDVEIVHALTGYVSDYMRSLDHRRKNTSRPIDISYRGSLQPLSIGRLGYEKRKIGSAINDACGGGSLALDLSSRWEDRIFGTAWFDFLAKSNAVLGVESGSNLFDYDGSVSDWCSKYYLENQTLDPWSDRYYLKAHELKLHEYEGNVRYGQTSPRHFEAAATRTVQVMYEGDYSGIFQANRHFVPLKRDLSNLGAVLDLLKDPEACRRMTDAAFEEIILNPDYHYRTFVGKMDAIFAATLERKSGFPETSPKESVDRPRAAYIMSHDPVIDPRVTWMAQSLAKSYALCEVGCHGAPGSGPTVQRIAKHHTRLIIERTRHNWDWISSVTLGDDLLPGMAEMLRLHLYSELKPRDLARQIGALGASDEDLDRFRWYLRYFVDTNGALFQAVRNSGELELVVATDLDTLPAALALGRLNGCSVIYDAHEYWPFSSLEFSAWESEFWAGLEKRLCRQADVRVSVSSPLAEHMGQEYGAEFMTVPNATPLTAMPSRKNKLGGEQDLVFLVQGTFAPGRGYERLLAAWPLVQPGIHLALRGPDTPYKQVIINLAVQAGMTPGRISFPAPVAPAMLVEGAADADVAIVPYEPTAITYRLACPNKFSEYLAAGRPVLSNNLVYLAPMIEDNGIGQVVDFGDALALSQAINVMGSDRERLAAMGLRARALFESAYNWEEASKGLFARIAELTSSPPQEARPFDFSWVQDRLEMRAPSASSLTGVEQKEEAGPDPEREPDLIRPLNLQALNVPVSWTADGTIIEETWRGLRIILPSRGLSYAALLPLDWADINFTLQDVWFRVSVTEVVGSILMAFFDPETDYIAAQRYVPEGQGLQVFYFKPEAAYADNLLFRTGPLNTEASLIVMEIEMIVIDKIIEEELLLEASQQEIIDSDRLEQEVRLDSEAGPERELRRIPLSDLQILPLWKEQGAALIASGSEARLTTPPIPWHYAAMAQLDWDGLDPADDFACLRLRCRDVEGDVRAGLFNPQSNEIVAEVALPSEGGEVEIPCKLAGPWSLLLRSGDADEASSATLQEISLMTRGGGAVTADEPSAGSTENAAACVFPAQMQSIQYWRDRGANVVHTSGAACIQTPPIAWHYAAAAELPPPAAHDSAWLEVLVRDVRGEAIVAVFEPAQDRVLRQAPLQEKTGLQRVYLQLDLVGLTPVPELQLMIRTGAQDAAATVNFVSATFVEYPPHQSHPPILTADTAELVNSEKEPEQVPAVQTAQQPAQRTASGSVTDLDTAKYWTEHNVTLHRRYASAEESLAYFHWRNDQYIGYIPLMPVKGYDDKVVLDYGCGPGHDLVGFGHYSKPKLLIGADVSTSSLQEAADRLALHGIKASLTRLDVSNPRLPFDDASVDHIHSSGVLHHAPDPLFLLKELRRILKPDGTMNIMVYNRNSLWFHLYVAYVQRITEGLYTGLSPREAFTKSTDGPDCPVSNVYRPEEWIDLCRQAQLKARFTGSAIALWEASLVSRRFEACMNENLGVEHRDFLLGLTLDCKGLPTYNGHYAGVDGCYSVSVAAA